MSAPSTAADLTWPEALARHLHAADLGTYTGDLVPDGAAWPIYLDLLPSASPDRAIALYGLPGTPTLLDGSIERRARFWIRGTPDPRVSHAHAERVCRHLHEGLIGGVTLDSGHRLVLAPCVTGGPEAMGVDPQGRHSHLCTHAITLDRR